MISHHTIRPLLCLLSGLSILSPAWSFAQENTAAQETTVTGGDLMLLSYLALWLLIFGFVFTIFRSQRALQSDLDQLQRRIDGLPLHEHHDHD